MPQTTIKYQHGIPLLKATERLVGLAFIRTANDDRKNTDAAFLIFNVNRPVNVYIFYSDSATTGPDWLIGASTPHLRAGQTPLSHLERVQAEFAAGDITLGGNLADGVVGTSLGMYVVVVEELH